MNAQLDPINEVKSTMSAASASMRAATVRIDHLEYLLARMVTLVDDVIADSEGVYPHANTGCIVCTAGTVPESRNTGLCALHDAKRALRLP